MYHPSTRLLTLLELLQARGRMSGTELSRRLEVSPRSVRRYIAMLQSMGIPIEGERGRYGQYRLRPGYKLPPLMLDDHEALAVTAGLLLVRRSGGLVDATTSERALAKLDRVLPEAIRQQVSALAATLVLDAPQVRTPPVSSQLAVLSRGVSESRRVWLRYSSKEGTPTERNLEPYGVVQRGGLWYTVGYCSLRRDVRIFRVDRIDELQLLEETFTPPAPFDPLEYLNEALATIPSTYSAEVLLKTAMENAQREVYPNLATLEAVAGGVLMRCTTDDLRWLARVLAGFSFAWEVREPPELETALREHAMRVLGQLSA